MDDGHQKPDPLSAEASRYYNDPTAVDIAKRFIAGIHNRWVFDNVTERGSKPDDAKSRKVTVRRFCPGAPQGAIRQILDMITESAPYTDPIVSGHVLSGRWRPRVTWFRKDAQVSVGGRDSTVTLVQDLEPDYEYGEGDLFTLGNCSEEITYEYVWDAPNVTLPNDIGAVGITYSIYGAINRDDNTGLYSYVIMKRTAIEKHTPPYVSEKTFDSFTVTESWRNLYELPSWVEQYPHEGEYTGENGEVIRVSVRQNDDCTYDIVKESKFSSEDSDLLEACAKTLTEHQDTKTTGGNDSPLGEADEAAGGVHRQHRSERDQDGTWRNTVVTTTENKVNEWSMSKQGSLMGVRTTVVNRNTETDEGVVEGTPDVGEELSYQRTDGGRYVVTKTTFDAGDVGVIATSERKTEYQKEETETSVVDQKGEEEATAENGVLTEIGYRRTEYGTWQKTVGTTTETEVQESRKRVSVTARSMTETTVDSNKAEKAPNPTGDQYGSDVYNEVTPGGLFNATRVVTTGIRQAWSYTDKITPWLARTVTHKWNQDQAETVQPGDRFTEVRNSTMNELGLYDSVITQTAINEAEDGHAVQVSCTHKSTEVSTRGAEDEITLDKDKELAGYTTYKDGTVIRRQSFYDAETGGFGTRVTESVAQDGWSQVYSAPFNEDFDLRALYFGNLTKSELQGRLSTLSRDNVSQTIVQASHDDYNRVNGSVLQIVRRTDGSTGEEIGPLKPYREEFVCETVQIMRARQSSTTWVRRWTGLGFVGLDEYYDKAVKMANGGAGFPSESNLPRPYVEAKVIRGKSNLGGSYLYYTKVSFVDEKPMATTYDGRVTDPEGFIVSEATSSDGEEA